MAIPVTANISTISAALMQAPTATAVPPAAWPISVEGQTLHINDPTDANDTYCISAALYRQTTGTGVYRAFLIVTFEVPVWQLVKLGLYHSRDIIKNAGVPPFAGAFGQTLGPSGNDVSFLNQSGASMTQATPVPLPRRDWTPADLINQLLVSGGFIDSAQWSGILAEVTIHHRQTVSLMKDDGSGDGPYNLDTGSRFAVVRSELKPGQPQPASTLFPSPYKDFSVDFIWHMTRNEFFRIVDFPVSETPALEVGPVAS
jgi:hypothetical protein